VEGKGLWGDATHQESAITTRQPPSEDIIHCLARSRDTHLPKPAPMWWGVPPHHGPGLRGRARQTREQQCGGRVQPSLSLLNQRGVSEGKGGGDATGATVIILHSKETGQTEEEEEEKARVWFIVFPRALGFDCVRCSLLLLLQNLVQFLLIFFVQNPLVSKIL